MRALFGLDPDGEQARPIDAAGALQGGARFYARDYAHPVLRGPRTPWARMLAARAPARPADLRGDRPPSRDGRAREDVLSLLLDAQDEDGDALSDRQIRDEVMTLLFAGHDTTTSTIAFMFYELAHAPAVVARARGRAGRAACGPPRARAPTQLTSGVSSRSSRWCSTRRCACTRPHGSGRGAPWSRSSSPGTGARARLRQLQLLGQPPPARGLPRPRAVPPRALRRRDRKARPAQGRLRAVRGGSRTCIGMRFGQLEIRAMSTLILSRFTLELPEGFHLRIRESPTIGPRAGSR